jgi:hypothetical protein
LQPESRTPAGPRRPSLKRVSAYAGVAAIVCVLACLFLPGVFINPFFEGRITRACEEAYPAHTIRIDGLQYDIWTNRLLCGPVSVAAADSTPVFSAARVAVTGVDRLSLLLGGGVTHDGLGGALAEAQDVALVFRQSQHELRCAALRVSAPDSLVTIDGLRYQPTAGDERYFAGSAYRRTRYRLMVPQISVTGLTWMMPENGCRARAVRIGDASLSVLIDKEKPVNDTAALPSMPAELLASLGGPLYIDSVLFVNGRLEYQERFEAGAVPAVLTWDSVQITAEGIGNTAGRADTAVVLARGILMGAGAASIRMSMPLASPDLSFRYSGSMGGMDLARFNPFLEVSEGLRLKSGTLHSVAFDIDVAAGKATGSVRAAYEDLKIVAIEKGTGSEAGIANTVVSFIANNVSLRTTNSPEASGPLKAGIVKYERNGDDAFLEIAWFALLSGIGDVVGF